MTSSVTKGHGAFVQRERIDSTSTNDTLTGKRQLYDYEPVIDPRLKIDRGPRKIFIKKSETGFGFNVRGQVSEGGPLKLFNGEFYAPLQQVSAVLRGGAAERAGLNRGDRILDVNGVNVDGSTHKQVVDLIKSGGDFLTLIVLAMPSDEINRAVCDNNSDDSSSNSNDYSERQPVPIKIHNFTEIKTAQQEKFIVFNISLGNKFLCSKRYKELDAFHSILKREFNDFSFPSFPGKWPFKMSDQQLETRRNSLDNYLLKVCSVKTIYESEIVRNFLCIPDSIIEKEPIPESPTINRTNDIRQDHSDQKSPIPKEVVINIFLPDQSSSSVTLSPNSTAAEVYKALIKRIELNPELAQYFYLFEIIDSNFERKLQASEIPYQINKQKYSTTNIRMKKWYFTLRADSILAKNKQTLRYLFHQAIEDLDRGHITLPENNDIDLKFMQENNRYIEYLKKVSKFDGYGELVFPHCACSSRKNGHVVVALDASSFKLKACSNDGQLEKQVVEFNVEDIENIDVNSEEMKFVIEVAIDSKAKKVIQIFTKYPSFMYDCVEKLINENKTQ